MKIAEKLFPYPVLTYFDDAIEGSYVIEELSATLDADKKHYTIQGKFVLNNEDIQELINQRKAIFILHFECSKTRYRKPYQFFSNNFEIKISTSMLDGSVEMQPVIISKEAVLDYANSQAHKDYEGLATTINVGEILAVAEPCEFMANKSQDSLKNFPSIFSISKNVQNPNKSMDLSTESDQKIRILLSEQNYKFYKASVNNSINEPILASMILFPAILNLLRDFEYGTKDLEDTDWFPAIKRRVEECGYNFDDITWEKEALEIAQQVIGDPLTKGLNLLIDEGIED
ncbi:hypothetical protein A1A1_13847 [Planococcus antarcticus DSM 14505]|uniref:Uncharacterized protein n=1 Tax=Planococcus antarcticus DSM 14505 TaxID=1185653 RepID=A0AA87LS44_9BACL|nr:hypothetical protein [Planococcus antarcticus]EIM05909.1 hypothetical protein A1A1_13847 [Planococcus antarcticus DSM 14505]